jgi:hypothetical protein
MLNSIGIEISKRQVLRLLTTRLDPFITEDSAVLHAGLVSAPFITVDDTGARHIRRNAYTTQIGGERFSIFRTSFSKSRLNFLAILKAGHQDYILNEEAMNWLRTQGAVEQAIVEKLVTRSTTIFADQVAFLEYLTGRGRWCSDRRVSGRLSLMPLLLGSLSVPDRIRARTFQHSIEDGAADGDLRLLGAE